MLHARLAQLVRRLRLSSAFDGAVTGLVAGLAAAALTVGLSKLVTLPHSLQIASIVLALSTIFGAIVGASRRITPLTAAILADKVAGTDEVLSTAYESPGTDSFSVVNVHRAEAILATIPNSRLLPRRRRGFPYAGLVLLALTAGLFFAPPVRIASAKGDDTAALSPRVLQALEKSARDVKRVGEQTENKELARLGAEMQQLAASAQLGQMTRKEALARIAALSEQAEQIKKEMDEKKSALSALEKSPAAKALADALAKGDQHSAKSEAGELAKKLGEGRLDGDQKKGLKDALDKMGAESKGALGEAAREASEALGAGDAKQFGDKMSELAEKMKGSRSGSSSKGEKGASSKGGDSAEGEKELGDAKDELADAEDDLNGDNESTAQKPGDYCPDCGKKKGGG